MRRRLLLSLAVSLACSRALAQTSFHGVAAGEVLRGRFAQQRTLQGFAHPLMSSGDFVLAPGRGLIWRTRLPFSIVTVITAAGLVQDVDGTETTHLTAARLPFIARLYDLLSHALAGDWHALDSQFQTTQQGSARQWQLQLVPHAGGDPHAMPFRAITLSGGRFLDTVRISRSDDDSDRLTFSDQTLGRGLSEAEATLLRQAAP